MLPSQILQKHRAAVLETMTRYPMFANLRVFGSVARREDTEESDIDFLVDSISGATLFDLSELYDDFEALLGIPDHITITGESMREPLRTVIKRDAISL